MRNSIGFLGWRRAVVILMLALVLILGTVINPVESTDPLLRNSLDSQLQCGERQREPSHTYAEDGRVVLDNLADIKKGRFYRLSFSLRRIGEETAALTVKAQNRFGETQILLEILKGSTKEYHELLFESQIDIQSVVFEAGARDQFRITDPVVTELSLTGQAELSQIQPKVTVETPADAKRLNMAYGSSLEQIAIGRYRFAYSLSNDPDHAFNVLGESSLIFEENVSGFVAPAADGNTLTVRIPLGRPISKVALTLGTNCSRAVPLFAEYSLDGQHWVPMTSNAQGTRLSAIAEPDFETSAVIIRATYQKEKSAHYLYGYFVVNNLTVIGETR